MHTHTYILCHKPVCIWVLYLLYVYVHLFFTCRTPLTVIPVSALVLLVHCELYGKYVKKRLLWVALADDYMFLFEYRGNTPHPAQQGLLKKWCINGKKLVVNTTAIW